MKYKVLLVDDHSVVREGLKLILETSKTFTVVDQAENGKIAIKKIEEKKPDIVLMDLNMPIMNGVETLRELKNKDINVPVVILTAYNEDKLISKAMRLGAKGYILKGASREQIFSAMDSAIYADRLDDEDKKIALINGNAPLRKTPIVKSLLSEREVSLLKFIAKGLDRKTIANKLAVEEKTVGLMLDKIYLKLEVESKTETEAVVIAIKKKILSI